MTILFISYWGIQDGLTQSTVLPHVRLLASFGSIEKVILCTIERGPAEQLTLHPKVEHIPLRSRYFINVFLNKINDFVFFPRMVTALAKKNSVSLIICRSSLAGGIGYLVHKLTNIPYVVESFEPHASYMIESGVWSKFDPRFWIENYFQKVIRYSATYILPVAFNYAEHLLQKGVSKERIIVVPCVVDLEKFHSRNRNMFRAELGIREDQVAGVYAGKFGGMYYDDEAFSLFTDAKKVFAGFFLIILTPDNNQPIEEKLLKRGFLKENIRVMKVAHGKVAGYLSAADFAFATYKESYSKRYLSPIKVGEYWACGLPVLLTKGVGDDSAIIENSDCGATFSLAEGNTITALNRIKGQLGDRQVREKNRQLATVHRHPEILNNAYQKIIENLQP